MTVTTGLERTGGPFLECLAATVAARSVLQEVIALSEEALLISDEVLRARLITMLFRLGRGTPRTPALPGVPGPMAADATVGTRTPTAPR